MWKHNFMHYHLSYSTFIPFNYHKQLHHDADFSQISDGVSHDAVKGLQSRMLLGWVASLCTWPSGCMHLNKWLIRISKMYQIPDFHERHLTKCHTWTLSQVITHTGLRDICFALPQWSRTWGLRCVPLTCIVHYWPTLCTMVHKGDLCPWEMD